MGSRWGKVVMAQIRGERNAHKNQSLIWEPVSHSSPLQLTAGNELGATHVTKHSKTITFLAILPSPTTC